MTLYQLGEHYIEQAELLKRQIESCSAQRKYLDGIRLYEANHKLLCLKEMERETRLTGMTLLNYYNDSSPRKKYVKHTF